MSAAKKKEAKEPTLSGVVFLGVLTAVFGAILGFLFMLSFPLQAFASTSEAAQYLEKNKGSSPQPGSGYYMQGSEMRSRSWERKLEQLAGGGAGVVELSAGELNAWMQASFRGAVPTEEAKEANVLIVPGVPNFFIDEAEGVTISLPAEITVFGERDKYVFVAKGAFPEGPSPDFQIASFQVNNADIPVFGGIPGRVIGMLLQAYEGTDAYAKAQSAWQRIDSVEVVGNSLRLQVR